MLPQSTSSRPDVPPLPVATLECAREMFDRSLVVRARTTRENYRAVLRNFFRYLSAGGLDGETATGFDLPPWLLEDYYVWLVEAGHKPRGAWTYVHSVQAYLRFLLRHGWMDSARHAAMIDGMRQVGGSSSYRHGGLRPVDASMARVVVHALARPIPPEHAGLGTGADQQRLCALRDRAVLATLFSTGLRRFEVSTLNRSDIKDGCAFVRGKGMRDRTVYFDRAAQAAIVLYLTARTDAYPALFIRHDDGAGRSDRRLSAHSIGQIVKRAAREVGLDASAHQFRHLKARVLFNNGAQITEVQEILGHNSVETTRRVYAHYSPQHIQRAWQRYSRSAAELVDATGPWGPTGESPAR